MLLFYSVVTIGLNINMHWCHNTLTKFSIISDDSKSCACDKDGHLASCCKNTHLYLSLSEKHTNPQQVITSPDMQIVEFTWIGPIALNPLSDPVESVLSSSSYSGPPLTTLHCSFLI